MKNSDMLLQWQQYGAMLISSTAISDIASDFWTGGRRLSEIPDILTQTIWAYNPNTKTYTQTSYQEAVKTPAQLTYTVPARATGVTGKATGWGPMGAGLGANPKIAYSSSESVNYELGNPGVNFGRYYSVNPDLSLNERVSSIAGMNDKIMQFPQQHGEYYLQGQPGYARTVNMGNPYQMCDALWDTKDSSGKYVFREKLQNEGVPTREALAQKVFTDHEWATKTARDYGYGYVVLATDRNPDSHTSYNVMGVVPYSGFDWSINSQSASRQLVSCDTGYVPEWQRYARLKQDMGETYVDAVYAKPLWFNDYRAVQDLNDGTSKTYLVDPSLTWGGKMSWSQAQTADLSRKQVFGALPPSQSLLSDKNHPEYLSIYEQAKNIRFIYTEPPFIVAMTPSPFMMAVDDNSRAVIVIENPGYAMIGVGVTGSTKNYYNPATIVVDSSGKVIGSQMYDPSTGQKTQVVSPIRGLDIGSIHSCGQYQLVVHGDFAKSMTQNDKETLTTIAAILTGQEMLSNLVLYERGRGKYSGTDSQIAQAIANNLRREYQSIKAKYTTWRDSQPNKADILEWNWQSIVPEKILANKVSYNKIHGFSAYVNLVWLKGSMEYPPFEAGGESAAMCSWAEYMTQEMEKNEKWGIVSQWGSSYYTNQFIGWCQQLEKQGLNPQITTRAKSSLDKQMRTTNQWAATPDNTKTGDLGSINSIYGLNLQPFYSKVANFTQIDSSRLLNRISYSRNLLVTGEFQLGQLYINNSWLITFVACAILCLRDRKRAHY